MKISCKLSISGASWPRTTTPRTRRTNFRSGAHPMMIKSARLGREFGHHTLTSLSLTRYRSTTQSFAITDARPQDGDTARQMKICPIYFTHDWSKQSTTSHKWIPNPGRRDDSWCKPEAKFRDFSVGGLVLLHEMTHLDAVTKAASYPSVQYAQPHLIRLCFRASCCV